MKRKQPTVGIAPSVFSKASSLACLRATSSGFLDLLAIYRPRTSRLSSLLPAGSPCNIAPSRTSSSSSIIVNIVIASKISSRLLHILVCFANHLTRYPYRNSSLKTTTGPESPACLSLNIPSPELLTQVLCLGPVDAIIISTLQEAPKSPPALALEIHTEPADRQDVWGRCKRIIHAHPALPCGDLPITRIHRRRCLVSPSARNRWSH